MAPISRSQLAPSMRLSSPMSSTTFSHSRTSSYGAAVAPVSVALMLAGSDIFPPVGSGVFPALDFFPPVFLRPVHNGFDDLLVAGAAAQVSVERPPDLRIGRIRVFQQQRASGEDHPRRAIAALKTVPLDE